mmetsp:Transcript_17630/g.50488  ORF Transcript_17630/g.50488 Transcript_17630/m.50488 type:complete len:291 (+) Transcript_17630:1522-2394(+)
MQYYRVYHCLVRRACHSPLLVGLDHHGRQTRPIDVCVQQAHAGSLAQGQCKVGCHCGLSNPALAARYGNDMLHPFEAVLLRGLRFRRRASQPCRLAYPNCRLACEPMQAGCGKRLPASLQDLRIAGSECKFDATVLEVDTQVLHQASAHDVSLTNTHASQRGENRFFGLCLGAWRRTQGPLYGEDGPDTPVRQRKPCIESMAESWKPGGIAHSRELERVLHRVCCAQHGGAATSSHDAVKRCDLPAQGLAFVALPVGQSDASQQRQASSSGSQLAACFVPVPLERSNVAV